MQEDTKRPQCPVCQSLMIPYLFGEPSGPEPGDGGPDDFFIMGCLLPGPGESVPEWGCRACNNRSGYDDDDE